MHTTAIKAQALAPPRPSAVPATVSVPEHDVWEFEDDDSDVDVPKQSSIIDARAPVKQVTEPAQVLCCLYLGSLYRLLHKYHTRYVLMHLYRIFCFSTRISCTVFELLVPVGLITTGIPCLIEVQRIHSFTILYGTHASAHTHLHTHILYSLIHLVLLPTGVKPTSSRFEGSS